ncbi:unnamed protein product, partial [Musa acuminata subsp. burmannicoides]
RHILFSLQLTPLPVVLSPAPFDRGFLLLHRSNERRGNSTTSRMRLRNLSSKESTSEGWGKSSKGGGPLGHVSKHPPPPIPPLYGSVSITSLLHFLSLSSFIISPSLPGIIGRS